jgi:hypothetical protein
VARHLSGAGQRVAFLYERGHDATFDLISSDAVALGGEAYALGALIDARSQSGPVWGRHPRLGSALALWARVKTLVPGLVPRADVARLKELREILAAQLAAARALLAQLRPSAIVASEDGISAPLAVHAAARHAGIKVVVVPFGYGVRRDLER